LKQLLKHRQAFLWQPGTVGRLALLCASSALIVLVAYLHIMTGVNYEFYVFFAPPVVLVAWFLGQGAGFGVAIIAVSAWFVADRVLYHQAGLLPIIFNTASRLLVYCVSIWLLAQLRIVLEREKRLAGQDGLTRLPNRRAFYERGRQALSQAQRDASPITAAFIDLDKFKQVNDEQGHETGDALLVCVAAVLGARLRSSDIVARLGGDEFALLLPGMDGANSSSYIEDLRQRLLSKMSERRWPVTFSIGVASYARAPSDLKALLAEADSLMYEAKKGGRDRILQKMFSSS
jgi:diguanylate cyclase (GGDEF)-like protein